MRTINIHQLSRLVDAPQPTRKSSSPSPADRWPAWGPLRGPRGKRCLGILAGKLRVPEDFDAPLPDELVDTFEGR